MRYSKQLLKKAEVYCGTLYLDHGFDSRLVHIPRTKNQADTLHEIQLACETIHRNSYAIAKDGDTKDPYREEAKAKKSIDVLKEHLYKYHFPNEAEMIAELNVLKDRLNIDARVMKPKPTLDGIISNITEQLKEVGFKDTNINDNILPVFTALIKE